MAASDPRLIKCTKQLSLEYVSFTCRNPVTSAWNVGKLLQEMPTCLIPRNQLLQFTRVAPLNIFYFNNTRTQFTIRISAVS